MRLFFSFFLLNYFIFDLFVLLGYFKKRFFNKSIKPLAASVITKPIIPKVIIFFPISILLGFPAAVIKNIPPITIIIGKRKKASVKKKLLNPLITSSKVLNFSGFSISTANAKNGKVIKRIKDNLKRIKDNFLILRIDRLN